MNRRSSTALCETESPSRGRRRNTLADDAEAGGDDVDRWVAMINAERNSEAQPVLPAVRTPQETSAKQTSSQTTADNREILEVTIEFGRTRFDEISNELAPGALLRLDQLADEPLDVVVSGQPVARGELIVVDGKLGVRIVEVLMLFLTWLALSAQASFADERPRERTTPRQFAVEADSESDVVKPFDDPFAPTFGVRSAVEPTRFQKANSRDEINEIAIPVAKERASHKAERTPETITPPSSARPNSFAKLTDARTGASAVSRSGWGTTIWPLVIVLALIGFGARWLKSHSPSVARGLPSDAFDVLGRKAIDQRTSVVLARCGSRILVLSLSPQGLQTLAEITDPVEVDCLAGLCHTTQRDHGLAETFRALLQKPVPPKPASQGSVPNESRWPDRLMSSHSIVPTSPEVRS